MRSASIASRRTHLPWTAATLLGSLIGLASTPQMAKANMIRQIVVGKCSNAMQADFKAAGKTPPAGMVDFTCGCVANEMLTRGQSLDQAKATCVRQANQQFGEV